MHIDATATRTSWRSSSTRSGTLTVVPDSFFVDIRALAGVQATNGGHRRALAGSGNRHGSDAADVRPSDKRRARRVEGRIARETTSFSISPYMLHDFSDIGIAKVGVSLNRSTTSATHRIRAHSVRFARHQRSGHDRASKSTRSSQTGHEFSIVRDTVAAGRARNPTVPALESIRRSRYGEQPGRLPVQPFSVTVYGQLGWEDITYSGTNALDINGLTWGVGTVLTPNPDSSSRLAMATRTAPTALTFNATLRADRAHQPDRQLQQRHRHAA